MLVYSDVNSSLAAALVCTKLGISLGHVEAGLRSRDRSMPEEINRILTDQTADLLFTPSAYADANLLAEGVPPEKIHCVGNVMIDTLIRLLPQANQGGALRKLNLLNEHRQIRPGGEVSRNWSTSGAETLQYTTYRRADRTLSA